MQTDSKFEGGGSLIIIAQLIFYSTVGMMEISVNWFQATNQDDRNGENTNIFVLQQVARKKLAVAAGARNFIYLKLYPPLVIIFGECDHHEKLVIFSKYHAYIRKIETEKTSFMYINFLAPATSFLRLFNL